jgi:predicted permease
MIISVLIENMVPLYILILLGYLSGYFLDVKLESLAKVAIFILSPVVIFGAITNLKLEQSYIALPFIIYFISLSIAFSAYKLSKIHFKDNMANLIGMTSGTGNTGYFGLPIIIALLGQEALGIYILMNVGIIFYEVSFGYYIGARGNHHIKDSIKKVLSLPAFHAAWIAIIVNLFNIPLPNTFYTYWEYFTGAWIVIGMMLIGIALSHIKNKQFNFEMIGWMFFFKFIVWPSTMVLLILIDKTYLYLFNNDIYTMFLLLGLVPHAANTVAYASELNIKPEAAAMVVISSTLFSMPVILLFFGVLTDVLLTQ